MTSIVERLSPHEAALYLYGRSDVLELQYQAMLRRAEREHTPFDHQGNYAAFIACALCERDRAPMLVPA